MEEDKRVEYKASIIHLYLSTPSMYRCYHQRRRAGSLKSSFGPPDRQHIMSNDKWPTARSRPVLIYPVADEGLEKPSRASKNMDIGGDGENRPLVMTQTPLP